MNNEDMAVILGTVAIEPKGEYDSNIYYEKLNLVTYRGIPYIAKQASNDIEPSDTDYWMPLIINLKGTTANRPTNCEVGTMYFDTTLNKPIWLDNTYRWIDSDGNYV